MKIIWFFFSLCLLVGCKRSDVAVSVEQTLPVIDLNAAYPEKKLAEVRLYLSNESAPTVYKGIYSGLATSAKSSFFSG